MLAHVYRITEDVDKDIVIYISGGVGFCVLLFILHRIYRRVQDLEAEVDYLKLKQQRSADTRSAPVHIQPRVHFFDETFHPTEGFLFESHAPVDSAEVVSGLPQRIASTAEVVSGLPQRIASTAEVVDLDPENDASDEELDAIIEEELQTTE
jgi:hypothetical protein